MSNQSFEENPILNSPFRLPTRHWGLAASGRPTGEIRLFRRKSTLIVPVPPPNNQVTDSKERPLQQTELDLEETRENLLINRIRGLVAKWRNSPEEKWKVSYPTTKMLKHWRNDRTAFPLFYCQVEAAETLIWLNDVARHTTEGKEVLEQLRVANQEGGVRSMRVATKMATGAGKTTVMAMLIVYHTINKAKHPQSARYSNSFLVVTPGITIRDRLRVLLPSDPNNIYKSHGIVPPEFAGDLLAAKVVITNYHTFRRRETRAVRSRTRKILRGNSGKPYETLETEAQMLERACGDLVGTKNIIVINDEAHHCYRREDGLGSEEMSPPEFEDKEEADQNNKAAQLWISGVDALATHASVGQIYDLSATPYYLRGSGKTEGELFPWVVSDFSLMDAIESGIVKLPRVPIDDATVSKTNAPTFRKLYQHIKKDLPQTRRVGKQRLDPENLPAKLTGALEALYSHYKTTSEIWEEQNIRVPPVFIIICNNTATSKLVYDYVSGYESPKAKDRWVQGKFHLFSNVGPDGLPLPRMRTLIIDSEQIESGEVLSDDFKKIASAEIEVFKQEARKRDPNRKTDKVTDEELLREVMNTIGKTDRLGEQIRCVVSVSMLTEGWDTNNVTHILGIRAFGTQLLCEQAVGRGLRRFSYHLEDSVGGQFYKPEYADVLGVPFTFAHGTSKVKPARPVPTTRVFAVDDRAHLAISFPRIRGYTFRFRGEKIVARFDENSHLTISPDDVPPTTVQQGIVGKGTILTLEELKNRRINEVYFCLAAATARRFGEARDGIPPNFFGDLVTAAREWTRDCLHCVGNTFPQYLLWKPLTEKAAVCIFRACATSTHNHDQTVAPVVDMFSPTGTTFPVDFLTAKSLIHKTRRDKCHVNYAVCDSGWELDFCSVLENSEQIFAYVRNEQLGFEVPYTYEDKSHTYLPDFIALVDDGSGKGDLLNLVVEIKGIKDQRTRTKTDTMNRYWVPAVNADGRWGRWDFIEITDPPRASTELEGFLAALESQRRATA